MTYDNHHVKIKCGGYHYDSRKFVVPGFIVTTVARKGVASGWLPGTRTSKRALVSARYPVNSSHASFVRFYPFPHYIFYMLKMLMFQQWKKTGKDTNGRGFLLSEK